MNKNKWFLNGGRGSGKSIRLLCETYENKIVELQNKVDTLQGFLDHDIEYDMDKTIQEQKIKIAELENENKVLAQNLEDTEIINKALEKENAELKEELKTAYRKGMRHMAKALKDYDRTDGAWTDYFEHTVDKVLQREQLEFEEYGTLADQLTKAKELLRQFLNAKNGEDTYKAEWEAEQFLNSEVEK